MPIPGVPVFEQAQPTTIMFDPSDRASLAVQALVEGLGTNSWDRDAAQEGFRKAFGRLFLLIGRPIETYPSLPFGLLTSGSAVTVEKVFANIDSFDGSDYPFTYPFQEGPANLSRRLWNSREGYNLADVNRLTMPGQPADPQAMVIHARAALIDGPQEEEPLLHLLGLPFDEQSPGYQEGMPTQVEELAKLTRAFETEHPELTHRATTLGGFAMLAAQRRIEGLAVPDIKMPMSWGFMRIPQLGRKTVVGDSYVGDVYSYGDQLRLSGSDGLARSDGGVGLSVGLKEELDPQAS